MPRWKLLANYQGLTLDNGHRRVVCNGYLPERETQTGIGPVAIKMPKVRDRGKAEGGRKVQFSSTILPPYLRRTKGIEELIPWLYLKGISKGEFSEALAALLGPDALGLSASTVSRLKEVWKKDMAAWQRRDLSTKRFVYFWADGIHFKVRLDQAKQCILVIIGADE
jgi:putative transposase